MARDVEDPETKLPVWKRMQLWRIANPAPNATPAERQEPRQRADLRIGALGSGSDYTVFLDHLGIASLNLGYEGEDGGGIYHSVYDDFYWYTHFSDTDFVYGRALAQTAGTAVMRLAGAELLPYDFDDFTDTIRRYIEEVSTLAREKREQIVERNRQIDEGLFAATDGSAREDRTAAEGGGSAIPQLRAARKRPGGARAHHRALRPGAGAGPRITDGAALASAALRDANARLIAVERALTLRRRASQPAMVQAPDLCARLLHRLWREDAAGGAGEHRAKAVATGR